jgi:hypothetical protein
MTTHKISLRRVVNSRQPGCKRCRILLCEEILYARYCYASSALLA